ncbi:bifunctional hydroxymethylpyrimidine kinase/phosphomethylpyrimidine kinase [Peptostreptococcus stomatis]
MKKVLTIAGSDSSGGAGIQTDLKTFAALGVYGMSAITAITAQNTLGVKRVERVSASMVKDQIRAIFEDIEVDAVKIGMLAEIDIIEAVRNCIDLYRPKFVVLDPVMVSTSGFDLLNSQVKKVLIEGLIPLVDLITPNLAETACILNLIGRAGLDIDSWAKMKEAGMIIAGHTGKNILVKGGHLMDRPCDVLVTNDGRVYKYDHKRINTKNTHGTGCTLSSAIAANVAKGYGLEEAVSRAKDFISKAIENSLDIGRGCGPTDPMGDIYKSLGMV